MIIFIGEGRLGNQLFQYAFLRTLAKEKERIIALNLDHFIETFDISNKNFKNIQLDKYSKFLISKTLPPFLKIFIKLKLISYVYQNHDEDFIPLPTFSISKGILPITFVKTDFFQSEKFFSYNKIDFQIKEKYLDEAKLFLDNCPSGFTKIFVHVRRGDYLFEEYFGIRGINLPKSYYEKAIRVITKEVKKAYFIFLSDDAEFVECCFGNLENKIISRNSMGTDLAIMSLCEYGIVSNSSFSWWGAYLMKKRKKVIFPKYWLGWKSKIECPKGIIPEWAEVIDVE